MSEELPCDYDVIIVGTGMVESIVAAAISRIGKKTLHLDNQSYYGQSWATFNFDHLLEWASNSSAVNSHKSELPEKRDDYRYDTTDSKPIVSEISFEWRNVDPEVLHQCEKNETEKAVSETESSPPINDTWTEEKIKSFSRKFNLDLTPKVILSKGPMVKLLIESDVSRYVEFLNIANILVYLDSQIEPVPYSKSDVFASKTVGVIHKRILMKILTQILEHKDELETFKDYNGKTFYQYLSDQNLPQKIVQQILYSIAMATEDTPCLEGVKNAQDFLSSLGFYGSSPFLWTMYGSCDLLQAFCRLSAVYGGMYCLERGADAIIVDNNNKSKGIISKGKHLFAEHIVISVNDIPDKYLTVGKDIKMKYPRALLLTDKPLYKKDKNGVSFLQFPLENGKDSIKILELDSTTSSCPPGIFVVHLIGQSGDSFADLEFAMKHLYQNPTELSETTDKQHQIKPNIIFKLMFAIDDLSSQTFSEDIPSNIHPCSGPTPYEIDYHSSISQAEEIFKKIYPEEDFFGPLPLTVDEEEIIDETTT